MSFISFLFSKFRPQERRYNVTKEESDILIAALSRIGLQLKMSNIHFKQNSKYKTIDKLISSNKITHEKIQIISGYITGFVDGAFQLNNIGRANYFEAVELMFSVVFGNPSIAKDIYDKILFISLISKDKSQDEVNLFSDLFPLFDKAMLRGGNDIFGMSKDDTPRLGLYRLLSEQTNTSD